MKECLCVENVISASASDSLTKTLASFVCVSDISHIFYVLHHSCMLVYVRITSIHTITSCWEQVENSTGDMREKNNIRARWKDSRIIHYQVKLCWPTQKKYTQRHLCKI